MPRLSTRPHGHGRALLPAYLVFLTFVLAVTTIKAVEHHRRAGRYRGQEHDDRTYTRRSRGKRGRRSSRSRLDDGGRRRSAIYDEPVPRDRCERGYDYDDGEPMEERRVEYHCRGDRQARLGAMERDWEDDDDASTLVDGGWEKGRSRW